MRLAKGFDDFINRFGDVLVLVFHGTDFADGMQDRRMVFVAELPSDLRKGLMSELLARIRPAGSARRWRRSCR